jgi:hypothetical protein
MIAGSELESDDARLQGLETIKNVVRKPELLLLHSKLQGLNFPGD